MSYKKENDKKKKKPCKAKSVAEFIVIEQIHILELHGCLSCQEIEESSDDDVRIIPISEM